MRRAATIRIWTAFPALLVRTGAERRRLFAVLALAHELDAELLQLAVEMSALETDALRDARDIAALARDVVLEVDALEGVARVAQRLVERQVVRHRRELGRL